MAINMMCMNSDCKFYWEDSCTKSINEERLVLNAYGQCETFEKGTSDWYEEGEKCEEDPLGLSMEEATIIATQVAKFLNK